MVNGSVYVWKCNQVAYLTSVRLLENRICKDLQGKGLGICVG